METQVALATILSELKEFRQDTNERFAGIDLRLDVMDERLDKLEENQELQRNQITSLLQAINTVEKNQHIQYRELCARIDAVKQNNEELRDVSGDMMLDIAMLKKRYVWSV